MDCLRACGVNIRKSGERYVVIIVIEILIDLTGSAAARRGCAILTIGQPRFTEETTFNDFR